MRVSIGLVQSSFQALPKRVYLYFGDHHHGNCTYGYSTKPYYANLSDLARTRDTGSRDQLHICGIHNIL